MENDDTLLEDVESIQQSLLRLSWAERRRMAQNLDAFHLTAPQYMTLRALDRPGVDSLKMNELAEAANQVSATMTGIIDRLEERGLAARQRDPDDRRAQRVLLTAQGKSLLEQIDRRNLQRMQRILSTLTPQERRGMRALIDHYLAATELEIKGI